MAPRRPWISLRALAIVGAALALGGCLKRTIEITSEPPGALVRLNDVEVGRTPLRTDFTFYGEYDVRLQLDGYEPITTAKSTRQPLYETPPVDLAADAIPADIETTVRWHFVLEPIQETRLGSEAAMEHAVARAKALRERLEGRDAFGIRALNRRAGEIRPGAGGQDAGQDGASGRAGTPATTEPSGTGRSTTEPAPTVAP